MLTTFMFICGGPREIGFLLCIFGLFGVFPAIKLLVKSAFCEVIMDVYQDENKIKDGNFGRNGLWACLYLTDYTFVFVCKIMYIANYL